MRAGGARHALGHVPRRNRAGNPRARVAARPARLTRHVPGQRRHTAHRLRRCARGAARGSAPGERRPHRARGRPQWTVHGVHLRSDPLLRREGVPRRRDRKSTRLNSSHVKISYAVFCLKKKKKTEKIIYFEKKKKKKKKAQKKPKIK